MPEHTRGPRRYEKRPPDRYPEVRFYAGDLCVGRVFSDINKGLFTQTMIANAHLVAAAPDLLEACISAVEFHEGGPSHMGQYVLDTIKAAIAKAKGETP